MSLKCPSCGGYLITPNIFNYSGYICNCDNITLSSVMESPSGTTTVSTYCEHEWVDVGFNFSKFVCKKCNQDKPGESE